VTETRGVVGGLFLAASLLIACAMEALGQATLPGRDLRDVIGVTHAAGKYHLTDRHLK